MMRWCLILLCAWSLPLMAIDLSLERMLSPGALSAAHQKYEKDCNACHENDNQNVQCLDCHTEVDQDVKSNQGLHGRKPGIKASECRLCHSEHQGKQADIVQLNPHSFDHQFTDFLLQGNHKKLQCESCHKSDQLFREAPGRCVDCHRDNDVHKGSQGEQCDQCHSETRWDKAKFDHSTTQFPLMGGHEKVACSQCHRGNDFSQAKTECVSCHKIDDVHSNRFGEKCDTCHDSERWKSTSFNHNKDTQFRLLGTHKTLTCNVCHTANTVAKDLPQDCVGCHRHDDVHFGKNGDDCKQCHANTRWQQNQFDHDKTGFFLKGAHQKARCDQCHAGDVHKPINATTCRSCHSLDDVHKKSLGGECQQCHNEIGWHDQVRFDHELTAFPLLGMHATSACESCHDDFQFIGSGSACVDCHKNDDAHKGALGESCNSCHHPISWSSWRFNHDAQTTFPLTGAHKELICESCHTQPIEQLIESGAECGQCHQSDDIHRGAYGMQCDTCHDTRDFSTLHMR